MFGITNIMLVIKAVLISRKIRRKNYEIQHENNNKNACYYNESDISLNSASYISYASDSGDFFAQYSGSTEASWGYKLNCTFTVNKIVGDKFIISLYSSITK